MKKAFTMMELIFVIVIIGILAAVVIPRTGSNKLREAAIQVVSHIRYTQHLAMVDDKFDADDSNWHKRRWQLLFGTSATHTNGGVAYSIFSDSLTFSGNPGISELAKNPMDSSKLLTGGFAGVISYATDSRVTRELNIGEKYGITSVTTTGCGDAIRIAFDYLGRPIKGDISDDAAPYISSGTTTSLLTAQCKFILISDEGSLDIAIEPETGYAHIL
ncbi:MAG: type II secretion system protein [Sulfurimonas sp.]|nr:type II secretion system protein [Sulfurimonas sp.]